MSQGRQIVGVLLILGVVLVIACGPKAAPTLTPTPQAPAPSPVPVGAPAAPTRAAWEEDWEKTLAVAKKEGRLVLYTALGAEQRQVITNPFESKYGVRVEGVSGSAAILAPKIQAELKAGIYSGDVGLNGGGSFNTLKGVLDSVEPVLFLPDLTDPGLIKKTWYFGELTWTDKAHTMVISLVDLSYPIVVNTNLVKPGEITTYRDLLDPK